MRYILFPHGGSGNHGCEAIVRTTKKMIGHCDEIILFSDAINQDERYLGKNFMKLLSPQKSISRFSVEYIKAYFDYHIKKKKDSFDILNFKPIISMCDTNSVLISIGGDNYCYGDNEYIYLVNRKARENGSKTVLWGCSVEPKDISSKMKEDLSAYDLIVARESITYEVLKAINKNTVLLPDPAFTLEKGSGILPSELERRPYIGINISPLIQSRETKTGITMDNYEYLIQEIIQSTSYNIALIPHVVWDHNNDQVPLDNLYNKFHDSKRVFLIEDQNCMQLKAIISRCRFFVGARTHATIAAYSTKVPTLVVGYSVKARGIAKDLFGTEENFVLPVQMLKDKTDLFIAFSWLQDNEKCIRERLNDVIPRYVERAAKAGLYLRDNGD